MLDLVQSRADPDVAHLVALARDGRLSQEYLEVDPTERARLHGAAIAVAWPVVFNRLTRRHELRRGHWSCARAVHLLADACLDRFHDDLDAVVQDIFAHARTRILNLEGWITSRLQAATVNGHRRRRGARGALQRPRPPTWLTKGLGQDPWLVQLAIEILTWVGVPAAAGGSLWPLDMWAERRATITGVGCASERATVERDIETVLSAMRCRPQWYADHVERPLGAKTPPVASVPIDGGAGLLDPSRLALGEQHRIEEVFVTELASVALAAIQARLCVDSDLPAIVASVVTMVFGGTNWEREVAELPYSTPTVGEHVASLVTDAVELDRIVGVVRDILAGATVGIGDD